MKGTIKFIDLFAGIGGIRCGLELAAHEAGYVDTNWKVRQYSSWKLRHHRISIMTFV